jgi:cation transport ATPase
MQERFAVDKDQTDVSMKETVLEVAGSDCAMCVHAIEHAEAKIDGLKDIRVDAAKHEIRILHDNGLEVPRKVTDLVSRLAYYAALHKAGDIQE